MEINRMKERPIPFSTDMVRAVLDGRKTQTRRVIKPQPKLFKNTTPITDEYSAWWKNLCMGESELKNVLPNHCPHGQPGDRLWVKETYCAFNDGDIYYKADNPNIKTHLGTNEPIKWKSGRFMFKKYARIWLEITNIKVERVQDISHEDIVKEGFRFDNTIVLEPFSHNACEEDRQVAGKWFQDLWDSLNEKRGYGWEKNPWVWVIGFERLK